MPMTGIGSLTSFSEIAYRMSNSGIRSPRSPDHAFDVADAETLGAQGEKLHRKVFRGQRLDHRRDQRGGVVRVQEIAVGEHHDADALRRRRFESGQHRPLRAELFDGPADGFDRGRAVTVFAVQNPRYRRSADVRALGDLFDGGVFQQHDSGALSCNSY